MRKALRKVLLNYSINQVERKTYRNIKEVSLGLFDYIEVLYSRQRAHSTLGYKAPMEVHEIKKEYLFHRVTLIVVYYIENDQIKATMKEYL